MNKQNCGKCRKPGHNKRTCKAKYTFGTFGHWWVDIQGNEDIAGQVYPKNLDCSGQGLTSLKGAPCSAGGDFDCSNNLLTSLKSVPEVIRGYFNCSNNLLTSLKGFPWIYNIPRLEGNPLESLEGLPFESLMGREIERPYNPIPKENLLKIVTKMSKKEAKQFQEYYHHLKFQEMRHLDELEYYRKGIRHMQEGFDHLKSK